MDGAFSLAECMDSSALIFAVAVAVAVAHARSPEPPTSVELEAALDDAKEHFEEGFKKIGVFECLASQPVRVGVEEGERNGAAC